MFRARTGGPASAVDQDVRPVRGSRRQRRRTGAGGLAMDAGWLARVVRLVVTVVVVIIVAGILLVLLKGESGLTRWPDRWTASSASTTRTSRSLSTRASPQSSTCWWADRSRGSSAALTGRPIRALISIRRVHEQQERR